MNKTTIETILLMAALTFVVPIPPSNEDPISLLPAAIYSAVLFGASRFLRHEQSNGRYIYLGIEVALFIVFAVVMNSVANILNGTV